MSTIQKTMTGLDGGLYRLTLSGTTIPDNSDIMLGTSPVVIKYAQDSTKYPGFRSVECELNIISDGDASWMYCSSPTAISVEVEKQITSASWRSEFWGYLEPFTFSQPMSGVNDQIRLIAIDAISANKYKMFATEGAQFRQEAAKYVVDICDQAGIDKIYLHPDRWQSGQFGAQISSNTFLPGDFLNDETNCTLVDVISGIAQLAGVSAIPWGRALYMIDNAEQLTSSEWWKCRTFKINHTTHTYTSTVGTSQSLSPINSEVSVTADKFRAAGGTFTIERAYGSVKVSPKDEDNGYVVPPVLDKGKSLDGMSWYVTDSDGAKYAVEVRFIQDCTGIECHRYNANTGVEMPQNATNLSGGTEWVGAMPIEYRWYRRDEGFNGIQTKRTIFIRQRPNSFIDNDAVFFRIADSARGLFGSYAFKVNMNVATWSNPPSSLPAPFDASTQIKDFPPVITNSIGDSGKVSLNCLYMMEGDRYYTILNQQPFNQGTWLLSGVVPFTFGQSGSYGFKSINLGANNMTQGIASGWIGSSPTSDINTSPIDLFYQVARPASADSKNIWISDLSIDYIGGDGGEGDYKAVLNSAYKGDTLSVDTLFTPGKGSCPNYRPAISINTTSGLGYNLKQRYANPHKAYQITLDSTIQPWSICTIENNKMTVDAMEWNVMEGMKTVVIN